MELHQIVQESVKQMFESVYEPEHEAGQTCFCRPVTKVTEENGEKVIEIVHNEQREILTCILISSQISLLEAELERKKGMIKHTVKDDSSDWEMDLEYARNDSIYKDITYLQDQITKCKELMK